jgi:hypothetical protein
VCVASTISRVIYDMPDPDNCNMITTSKSCRFLTILLIATAITFLPGNSLFTCKCRFWVLVALAPLDRLSACIFMGPQGTESAKSISFASLASRQRPGTNPRSNQLQFCLRFRSGSLFLAQSVIIESMHGAFLSCYGYI